MRFVTRGIAVIALMMFAAAGPAFAGDPVKGKKVFKKCKACHSVKKPKNKVGPHLIDVMGRTSGTLEGFKFSKAMKTAAVVWDDKTLDAFLKKPKKFMKGTKMTFPGLKKQSQRDDVIAYLKTIKAP